MSKVEIENEIKLLFSKWVNIKNEEDLGRKKIRYSGPVLGIDEYGNMLDAIFSDWWSAGKFTVEAEKKLAKISDRNYGLLCNAGSSANLLLMSAAKELYFKDGDKIITLSCGFPTTVNPIIQNRLIPVFLDIDLEDLNLNPELFEEAIKSDKKIKGLFVAHTLGFKSRINQILDIARKYNIHVFFDNCDSYGTFYHERPIQAYGKAATFSFYVAHHITMGEGGGIVTNDEELHATMRGFRNWGRYCSSPNCCIRSEHPELFCPINKLTKNCDLPSDYMVNYQFEYLGYNLKPLELQSAILIKQMDRIGEFSEIRKINYKKLLDYFKKSKYKFKTWDIDEDVSPFSFPFLIPDDAPFNRKHLVDFLKRNDIETRVLFGGNLMKHPAYQKNKHLWESFGTHHNANKITEKFLMIGVSQVNSEEHIETIINKIDEFIKQWQN
jgi:CDP-6-deoxy-D-xylo-4-hexulose-3-dehydrase